MTSLFDFHWLELRIIFHCHPHFMAKQSMRRDPRDWDCRQSADTRNYNYNLAPYTVYPLRPGLISLLSVFPDSRFLIIVNLWSRTNETIHKFNFCARVVARIGWRVGWIDGVWNWS